MTNPKILFVLYYKTPPHTKKLITRAADEFLAHEGLQHVIIKARGQPAKTLNSVFQGGIPFQWDWIVAWDPHFMWHGKGAKLFLERIRAASQDDRVGWVSAPVQVHGEQANGWAPFLKDMPGQVYRLLVAFRVAALQTIGGFHGVPPAGRNWLMATEMRLCDQGWTEYRTPHLVAVHDDPSLTMEHRFAQSFWAGRDRATLYQSGRGHPVLGEGTVQLAAKCALMKPHNWATIYHQVHEQLRLLGYGEGAGLIPQRTIPGVELVLKVHLDPPNSDEEVSE